MWRQGQRKVGKLARKTLRRGEEASWIVLRYLALAKNEQDVLCKVSG
jgi:hypothetical protein